MKFGGTSVADAEAMACAVGHIVRAVGSGDQVVAVVSAMAGETDRLVGLVREASALFDVREYDSVLAAGEQVSAGLIALHLQKRGFSARSWLGWQLPVRTTEVHGKARIESIETGEIEKRLSEGEIAVVAGFQGLSPRHRITTLGRGGTDTSAVAMAVALGADQCDIFTDVDGIYTADPRIVTTARKLDRIAHEEMLELASLGAKVLHARSVEIAMAHGVPLQVVSTFGEGPGTFVVREDEMIEQQLVSGIAYTRGETKITLVRVKDRPGTVAALFGPLAEAEVNVDMIIQSASPDGAHTDVTFTVSEGEFERARGLIEANAEAIGYERLQADSHVAKVSVVGIGMRSHAGVAQTMFRALAAKGINIEAISTSEIKVSTLIGEDYLELALRALHTAYGLDQG